jgi:hypothetical protein
MRSIKNKSKGSEREATRTLITATEKDQDVTRVPPEVPYSEKSKLPKFYINNAHQRNK